MYAIHFSHTALSQTKAMESLQSGSPATNEERSLANGSGRLVPQLEEDHRVTNRAVAIGEVGLVLVYKARTSLSLDILSDQFSIESDVQETSS